MAGTPSAEVDVTVELVRRLLQAQHPDLADLPLRVVANGWDNVTLRLGDELAVRVPRREMAAQLARNEQRWLPVLAPRLGVDVPVPVRIGRPAGELPWGWSVVPWFAGTMVANVPAAARTPCGASRCAPATRRCAPGSRRASSRTPTVSAGCGTSCWTPRRGPARRCGSTATRTRSTSSRAPTAACARSSTSGTSRAATRPQTWRPHG